MKRQTKITLTALGIAASVGLAGLVVSPKKLETRVRACCPRNAPAFYTLVSDAPTIQPTPTPEHRAWFSRVKCEECGQEYDKSIACTFVPTDEEEKHRHITPEEKARYLKAALKLLDEYRGKP